MEAHLVEDLAFAASRGMRSGDPMDRLIQEALLDEITRLRLDEPLFVGRPLYTRVIVDSAIRWPHYRDRQLR
jgi:hypothetical protein